MKINKKIIFIFLGIFITIGITYASWQAGGGVKWIAEDAAEQLDNRFTDNSSDTTTYGVGYYTDTYTGLKWQAIDDGNTYKWSSDTSYTEPTWNGISYDYPNGDGQTGTASTDYPAFAYCEGLGTGWRLPTKRELFSIITDTKPTGMGYFTALHSIDYSSYWSSTASADGTYNAWYGHFTNGSTSSRSKTYAGRVLCIHD